MFHIMAQIQKFSQGLHKPMQLQHVQKKPICKDNNISLQRWNRSSIYSVCLWIRDLYSRVRERKPGLWDEMLPEATEYFVQQDHVTKDVHREIQAATEEHDEFLILVKKRKLRIFYVSKNRNWVCIISGGSGTLFLWKKKMNSDPLPPYA